jgi:DNA-binding transcriptional MerR regulator
LAKKLYYKIGEACKHLDIQPYVLRYWETEFPMLHPEKSSSGQRVYNERDLATIRRIKELLYDEGYTIAGAKKKLESEDLTALEAKGAAAAEKGAREEPAEAAKEEPMAAPTEKKAAPKKKAAASKQAAEKSAPASDQEAAKQAAALRKGVEAALKQARGILDLLDSGSAKR